MRSGKSRHLVSPCKRQDRQSTVEYPNKNTEGSCLLFITGADLIDRLFAVVGEHFELAELLVVLGCELYRVFIVFDHLPRGHLQRWLAPVIFLHDLPHALRDDILVGWRIHPQIFEVSLDLEVSHHVDYGVEHGLGGQLVLPFLDAG